MSACSSAKTFAIPMTNNLSTIAMLAAMRTMPNKILIWMKLTQIRILAIKTSPRTFTVTSIAQWVHGKRRCRSSSRKLFWKTSTLTSAERKAKTGIGTCAMRTHWDTQFSRTTNAVRPTEPTNTRFGNVLNTTMQKACIFILSQHSFSKQVLLAWPLHFSLPSSEIKKMYGSSHLIKKFIWCSEQWKFKKNALSKTALIEFDFWKILKLTNE